MKRFLVGILTIIFFAVSSGVVVSMHYCMGKMRSAQLQLMAKRTCGCKKEADDKGCCKTKHQFIKLTDNYKASVISFQIDAPTVDLTPTLYSLHEDELLQNTIVFNNHSPPLKKGQPTYLLNCVFRI